MNKKLVYNCVMSMFTGIAVTYIFGKDGLISMMFFFALTSFIMWFITKRLCTVITTLPTMKGPSIQYFMNVGLELICMLAGGAGILLS